MVASARVLTVPNGGTVQVRSGLVRGMGPEGPQGEIGPAGAQGIQGVPGQPGQTNLYASFLSGPVSGTLSIPNTGVYTAVPLPTAARNDLLATPYSQSAFAFNSAGIYLVIARARFDAIASVTMNHDRSLRLIDSTGTVYEQVRQPAVALQDPTDVVLVKFINDPGTGTLYHFEAAQDDTNGAVNLSDLEVQIVLCGAGPAGTGISEVAAGVYSATTALGGFATGVTYSQVSSDTSMPESNGLLVTINVGGQGQQSFYGTGRTGTALTTAYTRTWDATNDVWLAWRELTPADSGPINYTPKIYANSTQLTDATGTGHYTQMGKLIFFDVRVTLASQHGTSGTGYFISLPFTASVNEPGADYLAAIGGFPNANPGWGIARLQPSTNQLQMLLPTGSTSANSGLTAVEPQYLGGAQAGSYMAVRGYYYID